MSFEVGRISNGLKLAAAGAVALLVVMFLPWYGISAKLPLVGAIAATDRNAWQSFAFIDVLLFLACLVVIAAAAVQGFGEEQQVPLPLPLVVAIAGIVALVLVAYRLIDVPGFGISGPAASVVQVERKVGPFLGLIASAAIAGGGMIARSAGVPGQAARTTGQGSQESAD